jgi:hypothetical protein
MDLQPLSTEFYALLRYGLFLVLLIHLPFLGAIIGGSTVSLFLTYLGKETRDPSYPRFSKELAQAVLPGKSVLFIFGFVPVLLVWFVYERILFDTTPLPWHFWSAILAILFAGFALLHVYRSAWDLAPDLPPLHVGAGAVGVLALILAFFLFANGYGILFNPEKLPLLANSCEEGPVFHVLERGREVSPVSCLLFRDDRRVDPPSRRQVGEREGRAGWRIPGAGPRCRFVPQRSSSCRSWSAWVYPLPPGKRKEDRVLGCLPCMS